MPLKKLYSDFKQKKKEWWDFLDEKTDDLELNQTKRDIKNNIVVCVFATIITSFIWIWVSYQDTHPFAFPLMVLVFICWAFVWVYYDKKRKNGIMF